MLRALGDYGRLMVFPSSLHMERTVIDPNNYRTKQSWRDSVNSEYLSILGLLIAVATVLHAFVKVPGKRCEFSAQRGLSSVTCQCQTLSNSTRLWRNTGSIFRALDF